MKNLRPLDRTAAIAGIAVGAILLLLIVWGIAGGAFAAIVAFPLAGIVLALGLFAASAYLAYRIGVVVVKEGILAADAERSRRATPPAP